MGFMYKNDPVAKGPVTRCLDELSVRADARARLTELRKAIITLRTKEFRGLENIFASHLFRDFYNKRQIRKITDYLRTYWFDEETGWWPSFQPIAPIYALGLLRGLNASLAPSTSQPIPFDSYWIVGHRQVELLNLINDRQVTLLIATPPPVDLAPSGIWSESSEVWATARLAGRTQGEVDPITEKSFRGDTRLRVRTFKIQTRRPTRT